MEGHACLSVAGKQKVTWGSHLPGLVDFSFLKKVWETEMSRIFWDVSWSLKDGKHFNPS